ncbi:DUF2066 domain-containing protein [Rheinheimera sp. UJ51]|uniref:DUF2066 domain-containing protein n=1 Tax=Rheinheimera sp. UJ51 TaxID=2892446 RepID=UPI001E59A202|nr:DUF2066 domain-containing protein [Rheinheimera sp. UJ51]MCC5452094.1 DUF2066 domain-containing protein [Rheinheimera sp. UJ51]
MVLAKWLGLALILLFSNVLCSAERPPLYQAEVSAEQTQQQWQREALQQVLMRVTGRPDIMQQAELRSELANAASYVKQFEAIRTEQGNKVRVVLDSQRIQQLLKTYQIPVWGGQRPEILFWIVEQQQLQRNFVRRADSVWLTSLSSALQQQALPFTLPLYDIDDLMLLTETDVWAGFWQQIDAASARYQADEVVVLLLETTNDNPELPWRLTALRQQEGRVLRNEYQAVSETELMQQYAASLGQELAQQFAILLNPAAEQHVVLQVGGMQSLAEVVSVERNLASLLGVSKVQIVQQSAQFTRFQLTIQMSTEQLLQSLQFEPTIQKIDTLEPSFGAYPGVPMLQTDPNPSDVLAVFQFVRR